MIIKSFLINPLKISLIATLSIFCSSVFAECRFNPEANQQTLINISKKQPNGQIYSESNSIVWENGNLADEIYYGGCDVLKFRIVNFVDESIELKEEEVFEIANKMAEQFWQKEDTYELAVKLSAKSFNREDLYNDKRLYQYIMNNPKYAEMTMLFDRIDNSITIEWIKQ
ncbi:hypothetical protein [Thorsellia anophelis]|uniref:Uncharacterized protein n=1 Tax=Thorsellia anophelis DSM 18579 TaxID=1123402 RepID=A0A1H9YYP5_9GAMM|nr:hypothetical protein [Thorsellia anophelis]SES74308.1 hypothetical protein SAMN02583745_00421 [Thorsellia anophelis DSM 18579]